MAVNCPWCNATFTNQQKEEFWGHVHEEHQLSTEDVAFVLVSELSSVQERIETLELLASEASRLRTEDADPQPVKAPTRAALWRQPSAKSGEADDDAAEVDTELENRPEFYF